MTTTNPYATDKLRWHPRVVDALRAECPVPLVAVQWMPELRCSHRCAFCAYGHQPADEPREQPWRNEELMSTASMSHEQAARIVDDLARMGVQGVEFTGGGEPTIWPPLPNVLRQLHAYGIPVSLVTHGGSFSIVLKHAFEQIDWRWVRVSIDAGTSDTYCAVRRVGMGQWRAAWRTVRWLADERDARDRDDIRVGVGFVVDAGNYAEVYQAAELARRHGACNIRLSLVFSPEERVPPDAVREAQMQAEAASEAFDDARFRVINLIGSRSEDIATTQDYRLCSSQHVTTIIGGDGGVYRCCTQAFTSRGLLGRLHEHGGSFADLWRACGPRYDHDPRVSCAEPCLYRRRNLTALDLIDGVMPMAGADEEAPQHLEWP